MGKKAVCAPESVLVRLYSLLIVLMVVWSRRSRDVGEGGEGVRAAALATVDGRLRSTLRPNDLLVTMRDDVELSGLKVDQTFLIVLLYVA